MNNQKTNQQILQHNESIKAARLPCRGCTLNCSDYEICNGRPWRIEPVTKQTQEDHNANDIL